MFIISQNYCIFVHILNFLGDKVYIFVQINILFDILFKLIQEGEKMIPSTYLLLDSSDPKVFKWFEPINDLEKQTCLVEMYVSGYSGIYPNPDLFNSYLKIFGSNGAKMD